MNPVGHPPAFWARDREPPLLLRAALGPVAALVGRVAQRRATRAGAKASCPVLCVGNVTVGGAGKTTVVFDLLERVRARGIDVHVIMRGYGGRVRGPHRVTVSDDAASVGDEAMLLAAVAPVWVGRDRSASAAMACTAGAQALIMDDGLQNPTLSKDLSLLVVDAATGFGNGRLLPLGPLREPVRLASARCAAEIRIGEIDDAHCGGHRSGLPVLAARLVQDRRDVERLRDKRLFAFAGIGRPDKFFDGLRSSGLNLVGTRALADHQPYTPRLRTALLRDATKVEAIAVTTPKDAARWGVSADQPMTVGVGLEWQDEASVEALLTRWWQNR